MTRCAALIPLLLTGCLLENDIAIVSDTGEASGSDGASFSGGDGDDADVDPDLVDALEDTVRRLDLVGVDAPPDVSDAMYDLGQALAFDKILSGNQDISCMTCHHPTLASADGRSLSIGAGGVGLGAGREHPDDARIPRNAPPLFNLHELDSLFWDGRVERDRGGLETPAGGALTDEMEATLALGPAAAQAMFPVLSADEMRGSGDDNELSVLTDEADIWDGLMARLGEIDEYVELFEEAYPGESFSDMTFAHAGNAIASFEVAGFASADSPWDRFLAGDEGAMTDAQIEGALLFFGPARCGVCHGGPDLSDGQFHNIGLPQIGPGQGGEGEDLGREEATGDPDDRFQFRTPPLRNVALTAPYGHAGQYTELRDMIAHYDDPEGALRSYDAGQLEPVLQDQVTDNADAVLQRLAPQLRGINLSEADIDALVAFMEALTDPSAEALDALIPAQVPSGLPVSDEAAP